jgi:hypothetical protein
MWETFHEPDDLWFKLIKAKYLREGSFFESNVKGGSQLGKDYIRLSMFLNGGLSSRPEMETFASFGRIAGYKDERSVYY